jgi:Mg-chelatase subunit ChlI
MREEYWPLVLAWLVAALIPEMPHPVLLLRGEQGTAKSTAAKMLTSLLDPCASQLRTAPATSRTGPSRRPGRG